MTDKEIQDGLRKIFDSGQARRVDCAAESGVSLGTVYAVLKGQYQTTPLVRKVLTAWIQKRNAGA